MSYSKCSEEKNQTDIENGLLELMRHQTPAIEVGHVADILLGTVPEFIVDEKLINAMADLQYKTNTRIKVMEHLQALLNMSTERSQKYYAPQPYGFDYISPNYDLEAMRNSPEFILVVQNAMFMQSSGLDETEYIKDNLEEFLKYLEKNK